MVNSTKLEIKKLPRSKFSAVTHRAKRLGLSPEEYLRQLIDDDLALDKQVRTTSLQELAAPYHEALKGMSDDAIDQLVDEARRNAPSSRRKAR